MNDQIIHAVMYRNYEIGTLCNSGAWGAATLFSMITDKVTCPGCRGRLDGGEPMEPNDAGHDRRLLMSVNWAEPDKRIVLVRCPHTIGLAVLVQADSSNTLAELPCPCNDRSEVMATVLPAFRRSDLTPFQDLIEHYSREAAEVADMEPPPLGQPVRRICEVVPIFSEESDGKHKATVGRDEIR